MALKRPSTRLALVAALLAGTALGSFALPMTHAVAQPATAPISAPATGTAATLPGFSGLVSKVRPAVVTITSTERVSATDGGSPFPPGSPQDQMFRHFFQMPQGQARTEKALGSGFIVDSAGHIVTNNHVIAGATKVVVTLDDGRELPAKVIGHDARTDIAVLKVEAGKPLPYLALGNSDNAQPGDWVVAMGNPFGLGGTVTAGIVSARGRDIGSGPYDDFLQIDAPINRGNSGGPLFSTDGTVIGVNTAIFSPSGGSVGIGFAIPSNLVKDVVAQLEAHGHIDRGFIGVSAQKIDPAMASALKLPSPDGALVAEVQPDTPAAAAGVKPGDVITKVGDQKVTDPRSLARIVADLHADHTTDLTVFRDGASETLKVTTAKLPDQTADATGSGTGSPNGHLGLALAPLNKDARDNLGLDRTVRGAVITEVRPNSPAADAGLQPGDVITGVGDHRVTSPEEAARDIRNQKGSVALRILRDGHNLFVAVGGDNAG
jgi:serine protease Do